MIPELHTDLTRDIPTAIRLRWPVGPNHDCIAELSSGHAIVHYPNARPDRDEVGPLILMTHRYVAHLAHTLGAVAYPGGSRMELTISDDSTCHEDVPARLFVHLSHGDQHWCWELLNAYFWPTFKAAQPVFLGRWPD